jgi:O-succinylbenzoic acid--CoA ligase
MHTWETLQASVQGFQEFFGLNQINTACVLPLHHVSGLMQAVRSLLSGGNLLVQPLKALLNNPDLNRADYFISLVPTQLQRLVETDRLPWLAQFQTILLGGAPAWPELLDIARQQNIRLAPTYGMTETASQIATLKPEAFLSGQSGCGQILPHAQVEIRSETGAPQPANQPGKLAIASRSLALGYYPTRFTNPWFLPDDRGWLDTAGNLHIQGRDSDKIITGGENVFPIEVEAAIRATGLIQDVCVLGINDRHWGQAIVALYIPIVAATTPADLQTAIAPKLSKFKRPKHWIAVSQLPRNAQGKIDRAQAQTIVSQQLQPPTAGASSRVLVSGQSACESLPEYRHGEFAPDPQAAQAPTQ